MSFGCKLSSQWTSSKRSFLLASSPHLTLFWLQVFGKNSRFKLVANLDWSQGHAARPANAHDAEGMCVNEGPYKTASHIRSTQWPRTGGRERSMVCCGKPGEMDSHYGISLTSYRYLTCTRFHCNGHRQPRVLLLLCRLAPLPLHILAHSAVWITRVQLRGIAPVCS